VTLEPESIIWATRGKTWGFRFLRTGGLPDPLPAYEIAFHGAADEREMLRRVGANVALRIPDPEGRRDASGRLIPHDFVVPPPLASEIHSFEDALSLIWEPVAAEFSRVWCALAPPSAIH